MGTGCINGKTHDAASVDSYLSAIKAYKPATVPTPPQGATLDAACPPRTVPRVSDPPHPQTVMEMKDEAGAAMR